MKKYSAMALLRGALCGPTAWQPAWRKAQPRSEYDVIIVGGGGHGLATAYYLAKAHGITRMAVLEKNWIGGGNTGRNTTNIRSNYLQDESAKFYDHSLKMWEGLSKELNYNVMFSQRGVLGLAQSVAEVRSGKRLVNALNHNGVESEWLEPEAIKAFCPIINISRSARYPILGATLQRGGGTARHDAVAWGYARAASERGVDIIECCEVTGIHRSGSRVIGVETTRGAIRANKVGIAVAGHSSVLAGMAGFRLPIESYPLQALVSEPVKPFLNCVIMSGTVHVYVNQSDKGELVIGAHRDAYHSYAQRGSFNIIERQMGALVELLPIVSRMKMLRQWAGIVDISPDASPIIGKTPVDNFFISAGWGTGGFKATPASGQTFAHTIATGEPHPLIAPFSLDRFRAGALVDEHGAAGVAH
jgi:sarcosine oxidase subunit beta